MTEVSRRSVTKGAVWAAPVVAIASAVPAGAAASAPPGPMPNRPRAVVTGPGSVGTYTIQIHFNQNYPGCTVHVTSVVQGGVPYGLTPKSSPIVRNWAGYAEVGTFTRTSGRRQSGTVTGFTTCGGATTPFTLGLIDLTSS